VARRIDEGILETGELSTLTMYDAHHGLALLAGGDFIKTSTGKVTPAATPPVALVMLEAVRISLPPLEIARRQAGRRIRTAKDAIRYLVLVKETAGEDWLTLTVPHRRVQPWS